MEFDDIQRLLFERLQAAAGREEKGDFPASTALAGMYLNYETTLTFLEQEVLTQDSGA